MFTCNAKSHRDKLKQQYNSLKKEFKKDRKVKEEEAEEKTEEKEHSNEFVQQYLSEQRKYSHLKIDLPKKGAER